MIPSCTGDSTASASTPENAFLGYANAVIAAVNSAAGNENGPGSDFTTITDRITSAYAQMNSALADINDELKAIDLGLGGACGNGRHDFCAVTVL